MQIPIDGAIFIVKAIGEYIAKCVAENDLKND